MTDRWLRLTNLLKAQQSNPDLAAATRKLIEAAYQQADRQGVVLPEPGFKDPIFKAMRFRKRIDAESVIATAEDLAAYFAKHERHAAKEAVRFRLQRAANTVFRNLYMGREGQRKRPGPLAPERRRHKCWCGCGQLCRNFFVRGHNNRLLVILAMVERGEMKREAIPENVPALTNLHWRKCRNCDGWMPTKDLRGYSNQSLVGHECRARLKRMRHRAKIGRFKSPEADEKISELAAMVAEYRERERKANPRSVLRSKTPLELWMMRKQREAGGACLNNPKPRMQHVQGRYRPLQM